MKKAKIIFLIALTSMLSLGTLSLVYADNHENENISDLSDQYIHGEIIVVRGEVLEWRYAYIDGIYCKRRWSITSNCWYDPYWIPV